VTPNASYLGKTVDEMLLDAGQAEAAELRAALLSLGTLASLPVPAPNSQLAALLAGPNELVRQGWLRKHRAAVVGLAVVAGMGLGVSGVAATASGQGRHSSISVQHLLEGWAPSWTIAGGPSASAAGLLPDPQPEIQQEPVPAVQSVPALPEQPLTGAVPDEPAAEAGGTAKKGDGGAAAKDPASAAGSAAESPKTTNSGTANESRIAQETAAKTLENGVRELAKVQNQPRRTLAESVERTLKTAIPVPATAPKTRAGKADPAASWLKKFSR
jgi:hypothetical protein